MNDDFNLTSFTDSYWAASTNDEKSPFGRILEDT